MNETIFKAIWIVAGIIMLIFYSKRKHTVRSALSGMLSGCVALVLLHYFGGSLGYAPPVNLFNTAVALILGVPGTVMIMAVNIFFLCVIYYLKFPVCQSQRGINI